MKNLFKNLLFGFVLFGTFVAKANVEKGNQIIALPKVWKFKIDPDNVGESKQWFHSNVSVTGWDSISVPGNWDVKNVYANYKGKAWYRTEFLTPSFSNKKLFLAMGEVGMSYSIYINGKPVATVLAGNYEEEFEIEKFVRKGEKNTLCILVDNSFIWGAYYSWGGLRRTPKLVVKEPIFIDRQEIIATPNLITGTANISTNIYISNCTKINQLVEVHQTIKKNNQEYITALVKKIIPANSTIKHTFNQQLSKEQVQLWHFDHPHLYSSEIAITTLNKPTFILNNKFGIRKIELEGYQFKLNGESVRLAGYNWVADDRTTGSVLPAFRYKEDIDLMKAAGANMARLSHRPLPQDVMDYLDEKGILILAELNVWPSHMIKDSKVAELSATRLVQQNFNHPCVFGWSVGNENGSLKDYPAVNDYTASIIQFIKKNLDSTRLVTYVSNTADFQDNDAAQYCDVIMINKYGAFEKGVDALKKRYPNKAVFMSEYGSHTDNLIYDTPDKTVFKSLMVDNLTEKENLFGFSLWTFNDYRSTYQAPNPLTTTPIHQNRQWGIVDVYRNKKRAYKQMQQFYAPITKMQVALSKNVSPLLANIQITPRKKIDIPAYTLKGYRFVWETRNDKNINIEMGSVDLPIIQPGLSNFQFDVTAKNEKIVSFKASLLSPTGYVVADTTIYCSVPQAPKIVHTVASNSEFRIIFEKQASTEQVYVEYEVDGVVKKTAPTIDHYIDIGSLSIGKKYKFWLVAKNTFGETKLADTILHAPKAGFQTLPPVIWLSEPADKGFFVGYSYHFADNFYEIRYTNNLNNENNWKYIVTNTFGLMQVPNLKNGVTYYYQIRKRSAFYAAPNHWSELKTITPNTNHQYGKVTVHGFFQNQNNLFISLTPSKNASSFNIICTTEDGKQHEYQYNAAAVELIQISLIDSQKVVSVLVKPMPL